MFLPFLLRALLGSPEALSAGENCSCGAQFCHNGQCKDACPEGTFYNWKTKDEPNRQCLGVCSEITGDINLRVIFQDFITSPTGLVEGNVCGGSCPLDSPYEVPSASGTMCEEICPYAARFVSGNRCLEANCPADTKFWKYGALVDTESGAGCGLDDSQTCYRLRVCTATCDTLYVDYVAPKQCLAEGQACPAAAEDFIQGKACVKRCAEGSVGFDEKTRVCQPYCTGLYKIVTPYADSPAETMRMCVSSCDVVSYLNQCLESCVGADGTEKPMYQQEKICVYNCSTGYVQLGGVCTYGSCPGTAPLMKGFHCVTNCATEIQGFPELNLRHFVTDADPKTCTDKCLTNQSYLDTTSADMPVKKCTAQYTVGVPCAKDFDTQLNGVPSCVDTCTPLAKKYKEDSVCSLRCTAGTFVDQAGTLLCRPCVTEGDTKEPFRVRQTDGMEQCYDKCPTTHQYLDVDQQHCIATCQIYFTPTDPQFGYTRICMSECLASQSYIQRTSQQECVDTCPNDKPYSQAKQCVGTCTSPTPFNENKVCVSACSKDYLRHDNGTCLPEANGCDAPHIRLEDACVPNCETYFRGASQCWRTCDKAYAKPYPEFPKEFECTDSCVQPLTVYNSSFYNGKPQCLSGCDDSAKWSNVVNDVKYCNTICPSGFFKKDTTECLDNCDSTGGRYVFNESNKMGQCQECQLPYVYLDNETHQCQSSCPLYVDLFTGEGPRLLTCVKQCPSTHAFYSIDIGGNTRCEVACTGAVHGNECVKKCPATLFKQVDASGIKCVGSCVVGYYIHSDRTCNQTPHLAYEDTNIFTTAQNTAASACPLLVDERFDGETLVALRCVESCPSGYKVVSRDIEGKRVTYMACATCSFVDKRTEKLVSTTGLCVDRCPAEAPYVTKGVCGSACLTVSSWSWASKVFGAENVTYRACNLVTCPGYVVPAASGPSECLLMGTSCAAGYYSNVDARRCVLECPNLSFRQSDSGLVCTTRCTGFYRQVGAQQQCVSGCDALEFVQGRECIAKCAGYFSASGGSQVCVSGCSAAEALRDASSMECVRACTQALTSLPGSQSAWVCVSTCPGDLFLSVSVSAQDGLELRRCLPECPGSGTYSVEETSKVCRECRAGVEFSHNLRCVQECPPGFVSREAECVSQTACIEDKGYVLLGKCQPDCGGYFINTAGKCAVSCDAGEHYSLEKTQRRCVDVCGSWKATEYYAGVQTCALSCGPGEFRLASGTAQGGACVTRCPSPYYQLPAQSTERVCTGPCSVFEEIDGLRRCLSSCQESTSRKLSLAQGNVTICVSQCPRYVRSSECVSSCATAPGGVGYFTTITNASGTHKQCIENGEVPPLVAVGEDPSNLENVTQCPQGSFKSLGICVPFCGHPRDQLGLWGGQLECTKECVHRAVFSETRKAAFSVFSVNVLLGRTQKTCTTCTTQERLDGQQCSTPCPDTQFQALNGSCVDKCGTTEVAVGKLCLTKCPEGSRFQSYNETLGHYECIQACDYVVLNGKDQEQCVHCDLAYKYYTIIGGQRRCTTSCDGLIHQGRCLDTKICPAGTYLLNSLCVNTCPKGMVSEDRLTCNKAKRQTTDWVWIIFSISLGAAVFIGAVIFFKDKRCRISAHEESKQVQDLREMVEARRVRTTDSGLKMSFDGTMTASGKVPRLIL